MGHMHESSRTMEASKQQIHEWQLSCSCTSCCNKYTSSCTEANKNNAHVLVGVTVTVAARSDSLVRAASELKALSLASFTATYGVVRAVLSQIKPSSYTVAIGKQFCP